jgi:UDP-N-acetylmuramoylalanine--D-glutamate ligase
MVPPLCKYEPRPHRCEFVREVSGVEYVNDSKATNLDAMDKALRAQSKPVILIAGGKDKGFSFDPLRSLVKEKVRSTILIGEMADSIRRSWSGAVECEIANSLADAVERAHASARPGEVVPFSRNLVSTCSKPADRGDQFRARAGVASNRPTEILRSSDIKLAAATARAPGCICEWISRTSQSQT